MKVLVFDIDGTLTDTNLVDDELLRAALKSVLPVPDDQPLPEFTEYTDAAILRQVHSVYPTADLAAVETQVKEVFFTTLAQALASDPGRCRPIPGADTVFEVARAHGWVPAIATGGWRESAETKLDVAGISTDGAPLASSSDFERRVDIIRHATRLATNGSGQREVVYIGDGTWDVRACIELGIGFVGVAGPDSASSLRLAGARASLPDLADADALLELLSDPRALSPHRATS